MLITIGKVVRFICGICGDLTRHTYEVSGHMVVLRCCDCGAEQAVRHG